jgi:hypothetical protein
MVFGSHGSPLEERDHRALENRWINRELAERMHIRRVDSFTGAELMGKNGSGRYEGLIIPYVAPGDHHVREYRLKRDHPEIENGKPKNKYLSPPGRGNMLYFPIGTDPAWLTDADLPLIITEGEFKTIALYRLAHHNLGDAAEKPLFLPVGISGVWNWYGTTGKIIDETGTRVDEKGPIPDLGHLELDGRDVIIIFDRDVETNDKVQIARAKLTKELNKRGAQTKWFGWPEEAQDAKGVDDLLAVLGPDQVLDLINSTDYRRGNESSHSDGPSWPAEPGEDAYYGLAGDIVRAIEPHSEADPAALLIQLLAGFGNMIGRSAFYRVAADLHYLNVYTVLVGPTSKGRKGQSWNAIKQVLRAADSEWATKNISSGLSSGEGLINAVRDPQEEDEPIRGNDKRVIDYQKVTKNAGVKDKRLFVIEPEFASVLRVAERDGSTISAQIRQAFDDGTLRTMTKTQMSATGAHISITGHITKDELLRDLTRTDSANGFANRFLWICVQRSKCLPDGGKLSGVDFAPLTRRLTDAVVSARLTGEMSRDQETQILWAEVYPRLTGDRLGMFGAVTGRAEAITLRLSCIYALLDRSAVIRVPHLKAALQVWRYAEDSARFIFGDKIGDQMADTILTGLRNAPEGLTRSDISKLFDRNKNADQISRAMDVLKGHGLADCTTRKSEGGKGRPTEYWRARGA